MGIPEFDYIRLWGFFDNAVMLCIAAPCGAGFCNAMFGKGF